MGTHSQSHPGTQAAGRRSDRHPRRVIRNPGARGSVCNGHRVPHSSHPSSRRPYPNLAGGPTAVPRPPLGQRPHAAIGERSVLSGTGGQRYRRRKGLCGGYHQHHQRAHPTESAFRRGAQDLPGPLKPQRALGAGRLRRSANDGFQRRLAGGVGNDFLAAAAGTGRGVTASRSANRPGADGDTPARRRSDSRSPA